MEQKIDLFTPIHKAIRALIYEVGKNLQTADFSDEAESNQTLSALENMLDLLEEHARHEDQFIFPPIEKAVPGISLELENQHVEGGLKVAKLHQLIYEIRGMKSVENRIKHAAYLNIVFTDFISFYLSHMNREEETVLPASQEKLSNEELATIRVQVQLDTAPERYTEWLQWMLPSLNINELVPLYRQVKTSAPAPVYDKIRNVGQQVIQKDRWDKLCLLAEI